MARILLLLLKVLTCFSGTLSDVTQSDVTLSQPSSVTASLEATAKLQCNISRGFYFGYSVWYQQKDGTSPKFLLHYNTTSGKTVFGSDVSDRFSVSTDAPKYVAYLNIKNVQGKDEADYYCGSWNRDGTAVIFGGGTQMTVTGGPTVPPTVHLFPPSKEEEESKKKATLVCLVDGFSPPGITVSWEADGNAVSEGVETAKPMKVNDKYVASSYLTMSSSDWKSHQSVSCKVTHEGSNFVKSVSHSQCP